jgi:hypothetical protein
VTWLYKAILPGPQANEFVAIKTCLAFLAEKIRNFTLEVEVSEVLQNINLLLDDFKPGSQSLHISFARSRNMQFL